MAGVKDLESLDPEVDGAPWCPHCRRQDCWPDEHGVKQRKIDLEAVEGTAEKLGRETGKRPIPFVLMKGVRRTRGFHQELPQRLDPERFVRKLLRAAGA
jgi:glutaredoxin